MVWTCGNNYRTKTKLLSIEDLIHPPRKSYIEYQAKYVFTSKELSFVCILPKNKVWITFSQFEAALCEVWSIFPQMTEQLSPHRIHNPQLTLSCWIWQSASGIILFWWIWPPPFVPTTSTECSVWCFEVAGKCSVYIYLSLGSGALTSHVVLFIFKCTYEQVFKFNLSLIVPMDQNKWLVQICFCFFVLVDSTIFSHKVCLNVSEQVFLNLIVWKLHIKLRNGFHIISWYIGRSESRILKYLNMMDTQFMMYALVVFNET